MKRSLSISFKAAFMLGVFSLNTVIGFACSVGLDMHLNSAYHLEDGSDLTHKMDTHEHVESSHHHLSEKSKDDCCKDEVINFVKIDKRLPQPFGFNLHPEFFIAFLPSFFHVDACAVKGHTPDNKFFVRTYHPPIPDIRLAVQSFQI